MTSSAESSLAPPLPARMDPGKVDPGAIERELRRLNESASAGGQPVRACMSNLIAYCDDELQAERIPPELGELVEQHPARVLLLVGESRALESGLSAEVSTLCYRGSGGRPVCADHVRVGAARDSLRRLPAAVRPLLVGDLPTSLWWATLHPPPASELFLELAPMADQVIYDSVGWRDAARGVISAADWSAATRRRFTDLAWSRLAPWRRLIADAFDPKRLQGGIEAIREVEIEPGPQGLSAAWLLIGWLARCLGWRLRASQMRPGVDVSWTFESGTGPVRATIRLQPESSTPIREIQIRARAEGFEAAVRLSTPDGERLALQIVGAAPCESVVAMRPRSLASLLASQLSERSADPLFSDALATAGDLARAVIR